MCLSGLCDDCLFVGVNGVFACVYVLVWSFDGLFVCLVVRLFVCVVSGFVGVVV